MLGSGAYSSVLTFNDAFVSLTNIFEKFDMKPSKQFLEGAFLRDCLRVKNMDQKTLKVPSKKQKKKMRAIKKGFVNKDRENEGGDAYSSGYF